MMGCRIFCTPLLLFLGIFFDKMLPNRPIY
nr:MAG TPA: hypothetical protein [Caudoviricetes sp.]